MFKKFVDIFIKPRYASHPEAVIICAYYNTEHNPYRLSTFKIFYDSIKHLNHRILETVLCDKESLDGEKSELTGIVDSKFLVVEKCDQKLWHKETILNKIVKNLPANFKYIFWLDTDITFTNLNWLTESVLELQLSNIIQPFRYCYRLEKDETIPQNEKTLYRDEVRFLIPNFKTRPRNMWQSYAATYVEQKTNIKSPVFDIHGHTGFAWGCRREVLEQCPLYDRALVGGADHIIAHASINDVPCECLQRVFQNEFPGIKEWAKKFYKQTKGKLGYTNGYVYHLWHGDYEKRDYKDRNIGMDVLVSTVTQRDSNGYYVAPSPVTTFYSDYIQTREDLTPVVPTPEITNDSSFGGGQFGGGGAGADWGADQNSIVSPSNDTNYVNTDNNNFS